MTLMLVEKELLRRGANVWRKQQRFAWKNKDIPAPKKFGFLVILNVPANWNGAFQQSNRAFAGMMMVMQLSMEHTESQLCLLSIVD